MTDGLRGKTEYLNRDGSRARKQGQTIERGSRHQGSEKLR